MPYTQERKSVLVSDNFCIIKLRCLSLADIEPNLLTWNVDIKAAVTSQDRVLVKSSTINIRMLASVV